MTRVLVTGASGFIGTWAAARLAKTGFEVHGTTRAKGDALPDFELHTLDLMDSSAVTALFRALRPTHLLHLAWDTEPGTFWTNPANNGWAEATCRLYEAFAKCGGERFVGAGSCAEYDWSSPILDEATTPLRPTSLYGQKKNETWQHIKNAASRDGLSAAWGRVFFTYGSREKRGRLVSDAILNLLSGKKISISNPALERDYIYVEDAGAAFAALTASSISGAVNIACGHAISLKEIAVTIGESLGRSNLIQFGTGPIRPGEPHRLRATVKRLTGEVGFHEFTPLEVGLRQTIEWWRSQLPR